MALYATTALQAQTKSGSSVMSISQSLNRANAHGPRQERKINSKFLRNGSDHAKGTDASTESFEGSFPPNCWTQIDADGDGFMWFRYEADDNAYDGLYSAASASWVSGVGALTPDNYLVSPQLSIGAGETLSYYVAAQDPEFFAENYGIYVSTAGNASAADFTDELYSETLSGDAWTLHTIDMSGYEGQDIYIAFRHFGSTDQFYMKIDMVTLPGEIQPCIVCEYPAITSDLVSCDGSGWSYNITFEGVPVGSSYILSNSLDGNTQTVGVDGTYTVGPFDNGQVVTFTLTDVEFEQCSEDIATFAGDCTEPCESYVDGPWIDFNTLWGGIPVPDEDGNCETHTLTAPILGGEAYVLWDLPGGSTYTFSACDGQGAGTFPISYTVIDSASGSVIAFGNDGDDCSISWETGDGGTFLVIVTYEGFCGTALLEANGNPSLTCSGPEGVGERNSIELALYPNPTNGALILTTPLRGRAILSVYDAQGRMVMDKNIDVSDSEITLDVSALESGLYVLQIQNSRDMAVDKFIKR